MAELTFDDTADVRNRVRGWVVRCRYAEGRGRDCGLNGPHLCFAAFACRREFCYTSPATRCEGQTSRAARGVLNA